MGQQRYSLYAVSTRVFPCPVKVPISFLVCPLGHIFMLKLFVVHRLFVQQ